MDDVLGDLGRSRDLSRDLNRDLNRDLDRDPRRVPTLLLTGTVGAGKSTIGGEISDAMAELQVPNAFVDLDGLIWQWPSTSKWNNDLMFENLASLWPNYAAHGSTHLVLARVLEDPDDLARYRQAVPGAAITICRLVADQAERVRRLRIRMQPGPILEWHLDRTVELHDILERATFEHFVVANDRSVREVAIDVLSRWADYETAPTLPR